VVRNKMMRWSCYVMGVVSDFQRTFARAWQHLLLHDIVNPSFPLCHFKYRTVSPSSQYYTSFESMGVSTALETLPNSIKVVILFALAVPSVTILAWLLLTRKELKDSNSSKFKFD
jgi:heme/copper-type cytochrome/quinol oxidase subunit 2